MPSIPRDYYTNCLYKLCTYYTHYMDLHSQIDIPISAIYLTVTVDQIQFPIQGFAVGVCPPGVSNAQANLVSWRAS